MQIFFQLQISREQKMGQEEISLTLTHEQARNVSQRPSARNWLLRCQTWERKISNKAELVELLDFCPVLGFKSAYWKGYFATEAINRFSVHRSKAGIWMLYPDSCLCNKYCQCWNNIERKQMTAVWRSCCDKLGLWWCLATELEVCLLIDCELWKYQDSSKLCCWLENIYTYLGRIKTHVITGDRLFPADRTHTMRAY